jgi:IS5 family transposase
MAIETTKGIMTVKHFNQLYVDGRHIADCSGRDVPEHIAKEDQANAQKLKDGWNLQTNREEVVETLKRAKAAIEAYRQEANEENNTKDTIAYDTYAIRCILNKLGEE